MADDKNMGYPLPPQQVFLVVGVRILLLKRTDRHVPLLFHHAAPVILNVPRGVCRRGILTRLLLGPHTHQPPTERRMSSAERSDKLFTCAHLKLCRIEAFLQSCLFLHAIFSSGVAE